MSVLTNLTNAVIRDSRLELDGKVISRPQLLVTDGEQLTYSCDVDIGIIDIRGYDQQESLISVVNGENIGSILHNVPIAAGNRDVIYAEVGAAVRLRRTSSGRYQIIGFSKMMPGTYKRYPINLETFELGAIEDLTTTARALTLAELADYGGFGTTPFGAIAIFRGTTFIRLTS